ncbi:hypothetical protein GCM10023171_17350 [Microbacterium panaciterrae]|uniref:Uncharacterized protein n=1 Tax=Microbacterium panaciterrae TaxID=985759 RepID=A0ABP8PDI5_9MICO
MDVHTTGSHVASDLDSAGSTEDRRGKGDWIDACVQERSSSEVGSPETVGEIVGGDEAEAGSDEVHISDDSLADHSADDIGLGKVASPHRFHHQYTRGNARRRDFPRFVSGHRDRLLNENMLTGGDRGQGLLPVQGVRGSDVHDVDLRIGDEGVHTVVQFRDSEL